MTWLFASGHAADIVLLVMAAEAALLAILNPGRVAAVVGLILPGALILLALRAALTGADWIWVALPLMLSLPAHAADLHRRGYLSRRHVVTRRQAEPIAR